MLAVSGARFYSLQVGSPGPAPEGVIELMQGAGDFVEGNADDTPVAVARPKSQFGMVDLRDDDVVQGFSEGGRVPYWVNCGIYVLSPEALARFPERGDHETTTFPELVRESRLHAYRHDGLWLTVNTPKELRVATEHVGAHPEWLA